MSRAFALSMTRPHERLGLPQPLGRRLPQGMSAWNVAFAATTVVMALLYVVQVNASTSKGYDLRRIEQRLETLKTETMVLQDKAVTMSSLQSISERAGQLGLEPTDKLVFVNAIGSSYALAH